MTTWLIYINNSWHSVLLPTEAVRFGRVPKREKAKIQEEMRKAHLQKYLQQNVSLPPQATTVLHSQTSAITASLQDKLSIDAQSNAGAVEACLPETQSAIALPNAGFPSHQNRPITQVHPLVVGRSLVCSVASLRNLRDEFALFHKLRSERVSRRASAQWGETV